MRDLNLFEKNNLKILTRNSVTSTIIHTTENGLHKSIIDATGRVRKFLKDNQVHNFSEQEQGGKSKVLISAKIYSEFTVRDTKISFYRPSTKLGDPRLWIYELTKYASGNEIISLIYHDNYLHIFNISRLPFDKLFNASIPNPFKELINKINTSENTVAEELLSLLRNIADRGPLKSKLVADTSVGRSLETILGINMNSSKSPDYKGIELKSFRGVKNSKKKSNRKTLFAQVSDWKISKFKSSAEILENFGYYRDEKLQLYCTVSASSFNSQGLKLKVIPELNQLVEYSNNDQINDFATWDLDFLHKRLSTKHKETFWISANSFTKDGYEYFQYDSIIHTKKPVLSQFDFLLEEGIITLDHLIKKYESGKVKERGPLFKIKSDCLDLLFPEPQHYNLQ